MAKSRIPMDRAWEESRKRAELLASPVAGLDLAQRTINGLEEDGILYVSELVKRSPDELSRIKNFGPKTLREIESILTQAGLRLASTSQDP